MNQLELRGNLWQPDQAESPDGRPAPFYFVPELWVDQQPLIDFEIFGVFLTLLQASVLCGGPLFILTCWCGMPECAGIYRPVAVEHAASSITWTIEQPIQRTLMFDATHYRQAIEAGIARLRRDWTDLLGMGASSPGERVILVPGWPEDEALLTPRPRIPGVKRRRQG